MERGSFWRAGLLPESPWEAHPVTIIANLGEPIGESRMRDLTMKWLTGLTAGLALSVGHRPRGR